MLLRCLKIVCALLVVLAVEQNFFPVAMSQPITPGPYYQPPPPNETGNIVYTTLNPPPPDANFNWSGFINFNTGGGGVSGGNVPAYNSATGTFIFGYQQSTVTYNFFGSNDYPNSGIMVDGFKYSWEYFNQDFSRGSISANIKVFDINNNILENYNFAMPQTTNGWTLMNGQIDFDTPYDRSELGSFQLSFTGADDRFWAGYYGPQVRDLDVSITYTTPTVVPDFLFWNKAADESGTFTLTEETTVRYGANGSYVYATLQPGTYECSSSSWGADPISGVNKSCELGSNDPPELNTDCTVNPTDPSCIINATDLTNNENLIVTDNDSNNEGIESNDETQLTENSLEEKVEDKTLIVDNPLLITEPAITVATMADESKANELADSISKNVLEGALAIAADATAASSTAVSIIDSQSNSRITTLASTVASAAQETATSETRVEENKLDSTESVLTALELLDTGKQLGREAMATTMAASEQSAAESVAQAENISAKNIENQKTSNTVSENTAIQVVEDADNKQTTLEKQDDAIFLAEQNKEEVVVEIPTEDISTAVAQTRQAEEEKPADTVGEETTEQTAEELKTVAVVDNEDQTETTVAVTDIQTKETEEPSEVAVIENIQEVEQIDSFSDIINLEIKVSKEDEDTDTEFVQQVLAASEQQNQQEETTNTGFSEEEKITIQNDPALANAFNVAPNVSNLEATGALNQKQEEKSDAEKRADEVVAANAKEQEEINKNYMDADQSGIVAAMGADTDVGAYRSAMLQDNNTWYKPEDIYRNVVYKDNVRNAYFLEKGNTDTYKKMVEEQYR